ncbi:MAG: hypothetical protein HC767_00520 [Akkermansiaceae bacterium]|nr:hypothetical protein [Akkermansiaceae bacterium]
MRAELVGWRVRVQEPFAESSWQIAGIAELFLWCLTSAPETIKADYFKLKADSFYQLFPCYLPQPLISFTHGTQTLDSSSL